MNVAQLEGEIRSLEAEIPGLESTLEGRQAELDSVMAADHLNKSALAEAKAGIRQAEDELQRTRDRLDALRARLPSEEEMAEASSEADRLRSEFEDAEEKSGEQWARFRAALAVAIESYRKADAASQRVDVAVRQADRLYDKSGIRAVPKSPQLLEPDEQRLSAAFAAWLSRFTPTRLRELEDPRSSKGIVERIRQLVA